MIEMVLRGVVLALVVGGAFAAASTVSRRNPMLSAVGLSPGLTLISGPGCPLCEPAVEALTRAGIEVEVTEDATIRHDLRVRSVPTAVVVDRVGRVIERRSGRAVIDDAPALASAVERVLA